MRSVNDVWCLSGGQDFLTCFLPETFPTRWKVFECGIFAWVQNNKKHVYVWKKKRISLMAKEHWLTLIFYYSKNFYLINFLQTFFLQNLTYFSKWHANLKKVYMIHLIYVKSIACKSHLKLYFKCRNINPRKHVWYPILKRRKRVSFSGAEMPCKYYSV